MTRTAQGPAWAGSRVAAVAALLVAAGHLPMTAGALDGGGWAVAVPVLLVLTCGHCALSLWRRPTRRTWALALVMAGGMLVLPAVAPTRPALASATARGAQTGMPAIPAMQAMPGMPGMTASALGPDAPPGVAALVDGPAGLAARWLLLLLAGVALVRCHVPRSPRTRRVGSGG